MELRGKVSSKEASNLVLRNPAKDEVPPNLEITTKKIDKVGGVCITAKNTGKRTMTIGPDHILARCFSHRNANTDVSVEENVIHSLVGPACEAKVKIEDTACIGLLDSGSQVTTVCRSFHARHLAHLPLESLKDTPLQVDGAGGQSVPFDGFINIRLSLPKEITGTSQSVNTVALVVPDTSFSHDVPVIIGTNTFRAMAETCQKKGKQHYLCTLPIRSEVAHIFSNIVRNPSGRLGSVRLCGNRSVTIPTGKTMELRGIARNVNIPMTTQTVMVQESGQHRQLYGDELHVMNTVFSTADGVSRVRVMVQNASSDNITITPRKVIADLFVPQDVTPIDWVYNRLKEHDAKVIKTRCQATQASTMKSPESHESLNFDFGDSPLPEEDKKRILRKLHEMKDVFATHEFDIGKTDKASHVIKLTDETPFRDRSRPIRPQDLEDARRHIQQSIDAGIIKPSSSPFASPIVLIRKKSGKLRLCVDYRKLNGKTIRDSYPIPKVEELFAALHGSAWFTQLDVKSAFHAIPMDEASAQFTAFVCPFGLFEYTRMSMGLVNSPLTFQRLMERCVGEMNLKDLVVYMDDLIIFAKDISSHEDRLFRTLERLRHFGLKLDPEKCKFFQTTVTHLGHVCSKDGISPDPKKIEAVKDWPVPSNIGELKSFLGFAGYYRRFVKGFSQMCKPLNDLTSGYVPRKTMKRLGRSPSKDDVTLKTPFGDKWTATCQQAFETIKHHLTTTPVLGYADLSAPFEVHTDASGFGLGAVLYQRQEDSLKVIAFASRGLTKSEANYPAHKREFLALKWAVTDKFHDYLYGTEFTVVTDNNPLTYVLKSAKVDAMGYRWLAALAAYNFSIKYRPGVDMTDADALSRLPTTSLGEDEEFRQDNERISWLLDRSAPMDCQEDELVECSSNSIQAILQAHRIHMPLVPKQKQTEYVSREAKKCRAYSQNVTVPDEHTLVEALALSRKAVPDSLASPPAVDSTAATVNWKDAQSKDPAISKILKFVKSKTPPTKADLSQGGPEVNIYAREFEKLTLMDGVLYRMVTDDKNIDRQQLVVPSPHRHEAMVGIHDHVGHPCSNSSLSLARQRFFWPFMATSIQTHCRNCERCIRRKARKETAPMEAILPSAPLDLVCMDYLSLEPDKGGIGNVLVITDHFTKYSLAIPTKDQKATTVAKALWENLICHYGYPKHLLSDQGRDFESKVIKNLCELTGIKKIRTSPYNPRCNGQTERMNRTLLDMLGTLNHSQKQDWRKYVGPLSHAYNCIVHGTTGYSPYYLMFGRHARLPIDLMFGTDPDKRSLKGPQQYVKDLRDRLQFAFEVAKENAEKSAIQNKNYYDQKARAAALAPGDRILVRNIGLQGKHKIADRWKPEVYVVEHQQGNMPVYVVHPESGTGPSKTYHRNLLLPIGTLSMDTVNPPADAPRKPVTRRQVQFKQPDSNPDDDEEEELLDSGVSVQFQLPDDNLDDEEEEEYIDSGASEVIQQINLNPDAPAFKPVSTLPDQPVDLPSSPSGEPQCHDTPVDANLIGSTEDRADSLSPNGPIGDLDTNPQNDEIGLGEDESADAQNADIADHADADVADDADADGADPEGSEGPATEFQPDPDAGETVRRSSRQRRPPLRFVFNLQKVSSKVHRFAHMLFQN